MNTAAFFDIDGTLYREGLITEVFKKLVKYEIIPAERWYKEVKPEYDRWDKRKGNYDNYLLKMADIYIEAIRGLHRSQVEFIAKNVVSQKGDRVYSYTRNRIKWHKEKGHKILTISGSPVELVREMAIKHEFDDYVGAVYIRDKNEVYTGEVIPMWDSESKKNSINMLVKKYNIDLDKSYAYGDTSGDFSMMKMVKNPVCVNPTRELVKEILDDSELCKKAHIIVERKDMIYKLKAEDVNYI
ncbi:HAD-IB family hydrolase [Clostridium sp. MT-14]|uniref:phosphoserine phosphatase n=1 Tax=Clostridium aromativorans TaxID=2836848 RepID=A0ABS8N6P0_9CLOT|nr:MULTISPECIES: HAD-IB family hydrolase [Clostridium]KAA8669805.1 HAD-IB family hydrolase [Clostridium sp. HV4-5-A1G]MCC9295474.1 HAD-IB family hydrolase [Clostridium aromativorans]CAB1245328.1 Phosphoserine phosphatase [Clostridiaceae bacterium BL-3]